MLDDAVVVTDSEDRGAALGLGMVVHWSMGQVMPGPPAAGAPALTVRGDRLVCGYPAAGALWLAEWSGGRWRDGIRDARVPGAREVALGVAGGGLRGLVVDAGGGLWAWHGEEAPRRIGAADPHARPALAGDAATLAFKEPGGTGLWVAGWGGAAAPIVGAASDAGPALAESEGGRVCAFRALSGRQGDPTWRIGHALAVATCDEDGWSAPLVVGWPIVGAPALARAFGAVVGAWLDPAGALRWAPLLGEAWSLGEVIVAGGARFGPALAAFRGRLVCAWVDLEGRVVCSAGQSGR